MGILLSCTGKSKNQKRGNVNDIGVEIKVYPITDDYSITTDVLGSGKLFLTKFYLRDFIFHILNKELMAQ